MTMKKPDLTKQEIRKKFVSYKEAMELYSMGMNLIQEHAWKAGAAYKLGAKVLINMDVFDAYLEQFRVPGENEEMALKLTPDLLKLYGCK